MATKVLGLMPEEPLWDGNGDWGDLPERILQHLGEGGGVHGVLGPRGSGKTSLLYCIAARAEKGGWKVIGQDRTHGERGGQAAGGGDPIFDPAGVDHRGPILFQLLRFLVDENCWANSRDGGSSPDELIRKLRDSAARWHHMDEVLSITKETAPSQTMLADRMAEARFRQASLRDDLKAQFAELVDSRLLRDQPKSRKLLLLVDDLDLHPTITLELLELLHGPFRHRRLVTIIAGHEPVLVSALDRALGSSKWHAPPMGRALLDKYMPIRWSISAWNPERRFKQLADWWNNDPRLGGYWPDVEQWAWIASKVRKERDQGERTADSGQQAARTPQADEPADPGPIAKQFMEALPRYPRQLKALFNRLLQLHATAAGKGKPEKNPAEARSGMFGEELERSLVGMSIPREGHGLAMLLTLSTEVVAPELNVHRLESDAGDVREMLTSLQRIVEGSKDRRKDLWHDLELWGGELPQDPHARRECLDVLERWVRGMADLRDLAPSAAPRPDKRSLAVSLNRDAARDFAPRPDERILAVSLNRDAAREFAPRLNLDYEVEDLDLTGNRSFSRKGAAELGELLKNAEEPLRALLADARRWHVVAYAQLSALLWLGWRMRRAGVEAAYNDFRGDVTHFPNQVDDVVPQGLDLKFFQEQERPPGNGRQPDHAILLIDITGKTDIQAVHRFPHPLQVDARAIHLQAKEPGTFTPESLKPAVRDVIEVLTRLKNEGVGDFHLALAAPDVFAYFLGRMIHGFGRFHLYELEESQRYERVITLSEERIPSESPPDDGPEVVARRRPHG